MGRCIVWPRGLGALPLPIRRRSYRAYRQRSFLVPVGGWRGVFFVATDALSSLFRWQDSYGAHRAALKEQAYDYDVCKDDEEDDVLQVFQNMCEEQGFGAAAFTADVVAYPRISHPPSGVRALDL